MRNRLQSERRRERTLADAAQRTHNAHTAIDNDTDTPFTECAHTITEIFVAAQMRVNIRTYTENVRGGSYRLRAFNSRAAIPLSPILFR